MQEKDACRTISDDELQQLIQAIQQKQDQEAMCRFLKLFQTDILRLSRFLKIPKEDAVQSMQLGMLELIMTESI